MRRPVPLPVGTEQARGAQRRGPRPSSRGKTSRAKYYYFTPSPEGTGARHDRGDRDDRREIAEHAKNWKFERIAKVDLAILRLAIYELLYRNDIPPIVSIN